MTGDLLSRLRLAPQAAAVFRALEDEPAVHVVGGAVRDVLLGRQPLELDLVVEGDAAEVARRAARRLGGEATVHGRFGTATVRDDGVVFDLASARRERYPRPGALPEVQTGATLAQDLARRDFTVNAVAVALADGRIAEHPGALSDIHRRELRILHPGSFRDDPTRLLRLCRYAARLGLEVEADTAVRAAEALAGGALASVSGERLGRELRLLAREPQPAALVELDRRGIGTRLLDPAFVARPEPLSRALTLAPGDARADLVALAASLVGAEGGRLGRQLNRLGFPSRERDRVMAAVERAPVLAPRLGAATGAAPSQLWALLAGETTETVALAGALAGSPQAADAVARWFEQLRHVRPAVTGHDLEQAGLRGPAVGAGLRAAQAAALDFPGCGREEQLAAALAAASRPARGA